jgi:hypothetical protein
MHGRRWSSLAVLTVAAAAGCFWVRRPYADDPLVRRRPALPREPTVVPNVEPITRPTPPGSIVRHRGRGADLP